MINELGHGFNLLIDTPLIKDFKMNQFVLASLENLTSKIEFYDL